MNPSWDLCNRATERAKAGLEKAKAEEAEYRERRKLEEAKRRATAEEVGPEAVADLEQSRKQASARTFVDPNDLADTQQFLIAILRTALSPLAVYSTKTMQSFVEAYQQLVPTATVQRLKTDFSAAAEEFEKIGLSQNDGMNQWSLTQKGYSLYASLMKKS